MKAYIFTPDSEALQGCNPVNRKIKPLICKSQGFFFTSTYNQSVMKLSIILLAIVLMASINPQESGNARVQKVQGIEVYVMSEPLNAYDVIDNGKVLATISGSCSERLRAAVKSAAKSNPDAIIFYLDGAKWEAIKFK